MSPTKVPQLAGSRAETQISPPPGPFSNLLGPFPLPKKVGEETKTHGSPPGVRAGLAVPPEQVPVAMERSTKGSGHNRWQLQVRMMRPLPGVWD